jgi:hypothetical protein
MARFIKGTNALIQPFAASPLRCVRCVKPWRPWFFSLAPLRENPSVEGMKKDALSGVST